MRSDHRHLTAYQIGCEVGQSVVLVLRPAILDRHILALDVAGFTKALPECGQIACTISKRRAADQSYHRHCRLLRAYRERPRCRAAEQCDEFATFPLMEMHWVSLAQEHVARYHRPRLNYTRLSRDIVRSMGRIHQRCRGDLWLTRAGRPQRAVASFVRTGRRREHVSAAGACRPRPWRSSSNYTNGNSPRCFNSKLPPQRS